MPVRFSARTDAFRAMTSRASCATPGPPWRKSELTNRVRAEAKRPSRHKWEQDNMD